MEMLRCKNCSGSDLKPFPGHPNIVRCNFCGTTYQLNSYGQIEKEAGKFLTGNIEKLKIISIIMFSILLVLFTFGIIGFLFISKETSSKNTDISSIKASKNKKEKSQKTTESGSLEIIEDNEDGESESPDDYKGEISVINSFDAYGDSLYYVALYKNIGNKLLKKPQIQINYYDENDDPVDTVNGYGFRSIIQPGDKTGVLIISKKKYKLARAEILHFPEKPSYIPEEIKLNINKHKMVKGKYTKYEILGEIENVDSRPGKFVSINAVLLDEKEKPVGMSSTYINEKVLKPGQKALFKINLAIAKPTAKSYFLETSGRTLD